MRIHHLALRTRQPERLAAFYADVLGLPRAHAQASRGANGVWLRAGDAIVMIEQALESEPSVAAGCLDLVAFGVTADELSGLEAKLARQGVPVEARTAFTLYFRDPDGRRVGVSSYAFPLDEPL